MTLTDFTLHFLLLFTGKVHKVCSCFPGYFTASHELSFFGSHRQSYDKLFSFQAKQEVFFVCLPPAGGRQTKARSCRQQHCPQPGRRQFALIVQMRSPVVVEVDDVSDEFLSLMLVFRTFHPIEPFLLDDSVDALGYGVVRGTIVLGHADGGVYGIEQSYVCVAAVLRAAVGMVDEFVQTVTPHSVDALLQSGYGVIGYKTVGKRPADDLVGEGIGEQVQIEHAAIGVYVSDVGHPQLIYTFGFEIFYHVLVLPVIMVRIGRMPLALGLEHQMIIVHETIETVTAGSDIGEYLLYYKIKLVCSYARVLAADFPHKADYLALAYGPRLANGATH